MIWNFDDYKNKIAMRDEFGLEITYAQLEDLGKEIAAGIGTRCLVFSFCENSIGSVVVCKFDFDT